MNDCPHEELLSKLYQKSQMVDEELKKVNEKLVSQDGRLHSGDKHFVKVTATLESIEEKVDRTFSQTSKTNGRVTRLEKWRVWIIGLSVGLGITQGPEIVGAILEAAVK